MTGHLSELSLDPELVGVAVGIGIDHDGDLGLVESDTQKTDGGGHVDVLGELLDGLPGRSAEDDGGLLDGVDINVVLGDVVGSGKALRSLGGDQLDGLQFTDGG